LKSTEANLARLLPALKNSFKGFKQAYKTEAAFRQEAGLGIALFVVSWFLPVSAYERLALIATLLTVVLVELLNTGIEAAIDRISDEFHPLSGYAKDVASAAVFTSLMLCLITWCTVLYVTFKRGF
jgi:diacylglycerol kinase (ATP)